MVLVANRSSDSVLNTEVPHENRDDQRVGLVACHLHEPRCAQSFAFVISQVSEEFHLEQPAGLGTRHPWRPTPPRACLREHIELFVDAFESMLGKAMQSVMEDSRHFDVSLPVKPPGAPSFWPLASPPPATVAPSP